jgi:hypothetical protein
VFTFALLECSRSPFSSVHVRPSRVFTFALLESSRSLGAIQRPGEGEGRRSAARLFGLHCLLECGGELSEERQSASTQAVLGARRLSDAAVQRSATSDPGSGSLRLAPGLAWRGLAWLGLLGAEGKFRVD